MADVLWFSQGLAEGPIKISREEGMKKISRAGYGAAALAAVVVLPAWANDAADHCMAYAEGVGVENPDEFCTCLVDEMTEEQAQEYVLITSEDEWEANASDGLKEAAEMCVS